MHAGERHFGGADQVLVVRLAQTVDLVRMGVEEAGAAHHFRTHQRRGDGQRESVLLGLVDGHGQHGDLHAGHGATQEVEAGAADLHAAFHIDACNAAAKREMVLGFEAFGSEVTDIADLLDDHIVVFAAFRCLRLDDIGQLPHGGGVFAGGGIGRGLVFGDLLGKLFGLGNELGLIVAGSSGDLLADFLLLRTSGLEIPQRRTTRLIGGQHFIDEFDGFPALALRFLNNISVFTNELNIKHEPKPSAA